MKALEFVANGDDGITVDAWLQGVAHEWSEELADARENIYTLHDGAAVHAMR
jgi:hypothetical protein